MGACHAFFSLFSKHLSSVLGRTELCHEVRNPGPQKPQNIRNENHHLPLLGFGAPERPRNSTPRFSNSGSRKQLSRGPLEPQKGSQGRRGGSSGASERGVHFQMPPEGVPALGLLPSGHREQNHPKLCNHLFLNLSGSAKWERLRGRNGSLSKIFADFCRFGP